MVLEIRTNFQADYSSINMGRLATWFDNDWGAMFEKFKNRSTWWYDNNADIMYGIQGNTACVQYGCDRSDYASARGFYQTINIANEVVNSDGSVDADVTIYLSSINGYKTSMSQAGYPAETTITLAGQQVAHRSGNTIDTFYMEPVPHEITKHVHLAPSTQSDELNLVYFTHYPQGQYPDNPIKLGLTVYNPLPPTYKPMSIRKGDWKNLNDNNGFIRIRHGGNWQDKTEENATTSMHSNVGHNRIRRAGVWKQLPKM